MADFRKNVLLVEGKKDRLVIPYLMEANGVNWGTKQYPAVYIRDYDGYSQLINPIEISTALKASGLVALGLMLDADSNPLARWQNVRAACLKSIPDIPEELPDSGLIHETQAGIRFGIWMMPDNKMRGMLETFLAYMIPDESESLWQYAQEVVTPAKDKGAPFKDIHVDKAHIHTWLAWQDPPGEQLHTAVMAKVLNPQHPKAQIFVNWFRNLYNL
ncbi:MAG: hypothetical protein F6K19_07250 [Cyanothece sp. SIO1E1]|nr:hypothetical protein [Cyanothece sp. SIO1E1]